MEYVIFFLCLIGASIHAWYASISATIEHLIAEGYLEVDEDDESD
jgi:hypothetical protein